MAEVQEIFLETEWDDEHAARQARDDRATQLQAEGYMTTCENLWTVNGQRVFLVEAARPERIEPTQTEDSPSDRSSRTHTGPKGDRSSARPTLKRRDRPAFNYETR